MAEREAAAKPARCNAALQRGVLTQISPVEDLPMSPIRILSALLLMLLLSACAGPGPLKRMEARLAEVESVAGEPVESFHFWTLHSWEPLGRRHLLVHTRISEGWLLRIDEPCPGLEFAINVGLSSSNNRVYQRFDTVNFDKQRCRIDEIRPVDVKALRALRREKAPEA